MLTLSTAATLAKNRIADQGAFLLLLEVKFDDDNIIRLVNNTENVVWSGVNWQAFPFDIDVFGDGKKGEVPKVTLRVSNVQRYIQSLLEPFNGGVDSEVILRVVYSDNCTLMETKPSQVDTGDVELEIELLVTGATATAEWVTFSLGASNIYTRRFPKNLIIKNFCRWKYGSPECGIAGKDISKFPLLQTGTGLTLDPTNRAEVETNGSSSPNYRKLFAAQYRDGVVYDSSQLIGTDGFLMVYYLDGKWIPMFERSSYITFVETSPNVFGTFRLPSPYSQLYPIKGNVYVDNGIPYICTKSGTGYFDFILNGGSATFTGVVLDSCPKTLTACRLRGNSHRFGGFPGVGRKGIRL
jgi:lambda family phage minor tail protein L